MSLHIDMLTHSRSIREPVEPFLPPGYRFHPTDEELVVYYLANKVVDRRFTVAAIGEVDLNKCEPWDLPERAKMGEKEWYFFSLKDRKYPTGLRTNRATVAGYWKATGKDREVMNGRHGYLVGMKKTLVFYKGRAPKGEKSNWIMHEYRLEGEPSLLHDLSKASKDDWVVCRIFKKSMGGKKIPLQGNNDPQASLPALLESPHTAVGADDSGITDSDQRDPLSYYPSCLQTSDDVKLWTSSAKEINNNLSELRYFEPPFDPKCNDAAYLNCFRSDQPSQDLRGFPSIMEASAMSSSYQAAAASSFNVLRKVLLDQQYCNSERPCKVEPTVLDEAILSKMAFKQRSSTTSACSSWPSSDTISATNSQMEASALINGSSAINSTQHNTSKLISPQLSADQVPNSIASICMDLHGAGALNQTNDYCNYSRHVSRPSACTGNLLYHNDIGALWTPY